MLAALLLLTALSIQAQSGSATYQIPRQSIDAGAGRAASSSYTVTGSIGQADASATMTSPSYAVHGGFHRAEFAAPPDLMFANGFEAP